jgi:radical SAM-linked protein
MRLRITFAKTEAMRFTGHLDLHRTWERTIRRAGLPLAYSQGFKPHPRIVLAAALPLGFTSECEVADIWLEDSLQIDLFRASLEHALPPGIQLLGISEVDQSLPALPILVRACDVQITFLHRLPDLDQQIQVVLGSATLPRIWREKSYDLRPLILDMSLLPDEHGCQQIKVILSAREGATGRPEEVVSALGGDPHATRFHRIALHLGSDQTS